MTLKYIIILCLIGCADNSGETQPEMQVRGPGDCKDTGGGLQVPRH